MADTVHECLCCAHVSAKRGCSVLWQKVTQGVALRVAAVISTYHEADCVASAEVDRVLVSAMVGVFAAGDEGLNE